MIKVAQQQHFPEIISIAHQSWEVAYKDILSPEQRDYMLEKMYQEDTLKRKHLKQEEEFIVFEENQRLLGFCSFQLNYPDTIKIHKLYLLPQVQKKGIGKQLIQYVAQLGKEKNFKAIYLNVNKYNAALGFYKAIGFEIDMEEVIDIGQGYVMDDYVMKYTL